RLIGALRGDPVGGRVDAGRPMNVRSKGTTARDASFAPDAMKFRPSRIEQQLSSGIELARGYKAMSSRVSSHIGRGLDLKQQAIDLISEWQYDSKTDKFPEFISGERHAYGEFEIDIERWFNEAEILTRGLLNADHSKHSLSW